MKKMLALIFLFYAFTLIAIGSDRIKLDDNYQEISFLSRCTNQDTLNFYWENYLKDCLPCSFTFESVQDIIDFDDINLYCITRYLRKYGISRLRLNKNNYYTIPDYLISPIRKTFFHSIEDSFSVSEDDVNICLGEDYLKKEYNKAFSHLEFYTNNVIKVYFDIYSIDNKQKTGNNYIVYLQKAEDNKYYFVCSRILYGYNRNYVENNTSIFGLNENTIPLNCSYKSFYDPKTMFSDDHDHLYAFSINKKNTLNISTFKKKNFELVNEKVKNIYINDSYDIVFKGLKDGFLYYINGKYSLKYSLLQDTIEYSKLPYHQTTKEINNYLQTFSNFPLDFSLDKTKIVYQNIDGLFLYDLSGKNEIIIVKKSEEPLNLNNIQFVNNDKNIFFIKYNDQSIGNFYLYDINKNILEKFGDEIYQSNHFLIDNKSLFVFEESYDQMILKIRSFDNSSQNISLNGRLITEKKIFSNADFIAFITATDQGNCLNIYNRKTKVLNNAIITMNHDFPYNDDLRIGGLLSDGRVIIFLKLSTDSNTENCYITKEGILK